MTTMTPHLSVQTARAPRLFPGQRIDRRIRGRSQASPSPLCVCSEGASHTPSHSTTTTTTTTKTKTRTTTTTTRRGSLAVVSLAAVASLAANVLWCTPARAAENEAVKRGLSQYVKKKKLDRIDSYLPPLFLAKEQLIRVNRIVESPGDARQQLRSGSCSGLRENIRSVGEYVSREKGDEKLGKRLVGEFFGELEKADYALLSGSRSEDEKKREQVEEARARLEGTIKALDALIGELPADVVDKSRSIADAVNLLDAEAGAEVDAGEAARLGRIL